MIRILQFNCAHSLFVRLFGKGFALKAIMLMATLLILLLVPHALYSKLLDLLTSTWQKRILTLDPLYRGQILYDWLDSFGPHQQGFNLGDSLPEKGIYNNFGPLLHEIWQRGQRQGGPVTEILRCLKQMLRDDLKRAKRERSLIQGAMAQISFMLFIVWSYIYLFGSMFPGSLPPFYYGAVLVWQFLGAVIFGFILKRVKKRNLDPLAQLFSELVNLEISLFCGNLARVHCDFEGMTLTREQRKFTHRVMTVIEQGKRRGVIAKESLAELKDDLRFIALQVEERLNPMIKGLSFGWALLFVLPLLFSTTLLGLYKLGVV